MPTKNYPKNIQESIENDIVSGFHHSGAILSLSLLVDQYNCSEGDIGLVISALNRKGLAEKVNDGAIKVLGLPVAKIESVFQYAQKSQLKPRTVVREVAVIPADQSLSEKLRVEAGTPIFQQVRTRLVDEHVLANQYNFIPYEICPGLEDVDLSRRSFQVTLEEDFHTVITRIEETYSLGEPTRDDVEILSLNVGENVLVVERMSYGRNELPLVYADIHVNPAQFHYVVRLWPDAEHLVTNY